MPFVHRVNYQLVQTKLNIHLFILSFQPRSYCKTEATRMFISSYRSVDAEVMKMEANIDLFDSINLRAIKVRMRPPECSLVRIDPLKWKE
jgi:hypothetical protein